MRSFGFAAALALLVLAPGALRAQNDPVAAAAERLATVAPELGWSAGEPGAGVLIVEFSDPSCPCCAEFHAGTRAALRREFVETGQVRWITVSYVSGLYGNSLAAAEAAECAGAQGRYEAMLDALYRDRSEWIDARGAEAARVLAARAEAAGLDMAPWRQCLAESGARDRIRRVNALAGELGVRGTPTWFVDGFPVMGALPLDYARRFVLERVGTAQASSAAYPSR